MSSTGITTSGGLTSSSTLTNQGAGGTLQITGLASGINTNQIIQAELALKLAPIEQMQSQIAGLTTQDNILQSLQSGLQLAQIDAQTLGSATMFFQSQTVTSSNSSVVSAVAGSRIGAVIGSSTIAVTQLASAAQRTFNFTSPSADGTLTIDGQSLTLAAGTTSASLADQINTSDTLDVWASATSSGQIVLSSRSTGDNGASFINVSDTTGSLVEDPTLAQNGQDAAYSINGSTTLQYSHTDTVTGALPGITLTLSAVTGSTPVTITTSPPGPNVSQIVAAVQQFVSDYNSAISGVQSAINTAPASETNAASYNPNSGSLFGDNELERMLSRLRTTMIQPGSGLPAGMAALADIGVSTGSSNGMLNMNSINGMLTVNTDQLTQALETNPSGVQAVLQAWSNNFNSVVGAAAGPGGDISTRINGNSQEATNLQSQFQQMQTLYQQQEADMEQMWAKVEGTLSLLKGQSSSLASFASAASANNSSSSSSSH
jgi:flagellar hook-associated protein 2